jgi:hypothetical protein
MTNCCADSCACRLTYPESRKERASHFGGYVLKPRHTDLIAASEWSQANPHACDWEKRNECIAFHYPGGWPAFIKEQIEK